MQETWVRALGQEDPLEKEMAIYSNIPAQEIPWTENRGAQRPTVHGVSRVSQDLVIKPNQMKENTRKKLTTVALGEYVDHYWTWVENSVGYMLTNMKLLKDLER